MGFWGAIGSAAKEGAESFPAYEEKVTVQINGNPKSNKADLFRLAVAIAYGQAFHPGRAVPIPFSITADFDMMGKSVTLELLHLYTGPLAKTIGGIGGFFGSGFQSVFFDPPDEDLVTKRPTGFFFNMLPGDSDKQWPPGKKVAVGNVSEGIFNPLAISNAFFPNNPTPQDNGTRGTFLEQLVFSSLATSCVNNNSWSRINNPPRQPPVIDVTPRVLPNAGIGGDLTDLGTTIPSGLVQAVMDGLGQGVA